MVNYIKENNPFYPTDHCGVLRVNGNEVNPRYLTWLLGREGEAVNFSRNHRASIDRIKGLSIKVPDIEDQNKTANEVIKLEQKIIQAQAKLEKSPEKKQQTLDNYLK